MFRPFSSRGKKHVDDRASIEEIRNCISSIKKGGAKAESAIDRLQFLALDEGSAEHIVACDGVAAVAKVAQSSWESFIAERDRERPGGRRPSESGRSGGVSTPTISKAGKKLANLLERTLEIINAVSRCSGGKEPLLSEDLLGFIFRVLNTQTNGDEELRVLAASTLCNLSGSAGFYDFFAIGDRDTAERMPGEEQPEGESSPDDVGRHRLLSMNSQLDYTTFLVLLWDRNTTIRDYGLIILYNAVKNAPMKSTFLQPALASSLFSFLLATLSTMTDNTCEQPIAEKESNWNCVDKTSLILVSWARRYTTSEATDYMEVLRGEKIWKPVESLFLRNGGIEAFEGLLRLSPIVARPQRLSRRPSYAKGTLAEGSSGLFSGASSSTSTNGNWVFGPELVAIVLVIHFFPSLGLHLDSFPSPLPETARAWIAGEALGIGGSESSSSPRTVTGTVVTLLDKYMKKYGLSKDSPAAVSKTLARCAVRVSTTNLCECLWKTLRQTSLVSVIEGKKNQVTLDKGLRLFCLPAFPPAVAASLALSDFSALYSARGDVLWGYASKEQRQALLDLDSEAAEALRQRNERIAGSNRGTAALESRKASGDQSSTAGGLPEDSLDHIQTVLVDIQRVFFTAAIVLAKCIVRLPPQERAYVFGFVERKVKKWKTRMGRSHIHPPKSKGEDPAVSAQSKDTAGLGEAVQTGTNVLTLEFGPAVFFDLAREMCERVALIRGGDRVVASIESLIGPVPLSVGASRRRRTRNSRTHHSSLNGADASPSALLAVGEDLASVSSPLSHVMSPYSGRLEDVHAREGPVGTPAKTPSSNGAPNAPSLHPRGALGGVSSYFFLGLASVGVDKDGQHGTVDALHPFAMAARCGVEAQYLFTVENEDTLDRGRRMASHKEGSREEKALRTIEMMKRFFSSQREHTSLICDLIHQEERQCAATVANIGRNSLCPAQKTVLLCVPSFQKALDRMKLAVKKLHQYTDKTSSEHSLRRKMTPAYEFEVNLGALTVDVMESVIKVIKQIQRGSLHPDAAASAIADVCSQAETLQTELAGLNGDPPSWEVDPKAPVASDSDVVEAVEAFICGVCYSDLAEPPLRSLGASAEIKETLGAGEGGVATAEEEDEEEEDEHIDREILLTTSPWKSRRSSFLEDGEEAADDDVNAGRLEAPEIVTKTWVRLLPWREEGSDVWKMKLWRKRVEEASLEMRNELRALRFFIKPPHLDAPERLISGVAVPVEEAQKLQRAVYELTLSSSVDQAAGCLALLPEITSPAGKLQILLFAVKELMGVREGEEQPASMQAISADDFLPVFIFACLEACRRSGMDVKHEADFISRFRYPPYLRGEAAYYMTHLFGAAQFLERSIAEATLPSADSEREKEGDKEGKSDRLHHCLSMHMEEYLRGREASKEVMGSWLKWEMELLRKRRIWEKMRDDSDPRKHEKRLSRTASFGGDRDHVEEAKIQLSERRPKGALARSFTLGAIPLSMNAPLKGDSLFETEFGPGSYDGSKESLVQGASLLGKVAETEEEAEEEDENEKAFSPTRATTRGKEKHSSTTSSLATDALLSDIVGEEDEKLDELVMSLATKTKLKADEAVASSSSSPLVKTKQLEKQVEEKAEETKDKEETEGIAARAAAEKRGRIDRGEADQFEGEEGGDDEDVTLSLSEVEEMEEEIEELEAVEAEAVHEEVKWLQNEIEDEGEVKDATEPYSKSSRVPLFVDEEEVDEDDNSEKSDSVRKTLGELWAESEPSARSMETSDGRKDRPPQMPVRNSVGALIVPYATLSTVSSDPLPSFVKVSERERYLADEEFVNIFSMSREAFEKLPQWKKETEKRRAHLF